MIDHTELWERIVTSLTRAPAGYALTSREAGQCSSSLLDRTSGSTDCPNGAEGKKRNCIAVQAVERQSDHAMLISWSDATRGHFGDQRWTSARSRCSGLCVLTGSIIRRGDPVYKRQHRDASRKITGIEMILAVALERMAGQEAMA